MVAISIVVPAYNEEKAIFNTLGEIKSIVRKIKHRIEIIAVDDCSTDKTKFILKSIKGITLIENPANFGYGACLKSAIRKSKADYILIIDADGTYPVHSIPELIAKLKDNDMVVGARTGKYVNIPFFRRPAKWFLKHFAQ